MPNRVALEQQLANEQRWWIRHGARLQASAAPSDRDAARMALQRMTGLQQRLALLRGETTRLNAIATPAAAAPAAVATPGPSRRRAFAIGVIGAAGIALLRRLF